MTDSAWAFGRVNLYERGQIVLVEINAPEIRNALAVDIVASLNAVADELESRHATASEPRCIVLTGAGSSFCAGGDLTTAHAVASGELSRDDPSLEAFTEDALHNAFMRLRALGAPLIAAVNGPAVGMGLSMALAADLIVAARSASFSAAFVRVGMGPEGGLSWRLPRIVGELRAREMILLGERVPAETALAWGLANRLFEDEGFREAVWAFAEQVTRSGPIALGEARRLADSAWSRDYEAQVEDEHRTGAMLGRTAESAEAFRAFVRRSQRD